MHPRLKVMLPSTRSLNGPDESSRAISGFFRPSKDSVIEINMIILDILLYVVHHNILSRKRVQ
jgi:hypothetical protein